jgi:hypothetical protein
MPAWGELFVVRVAGKLVGEQFRSRVQLLLASIVPGLPDLDSRLSRQELLCGC